MTLVNLDPTRTLYNMAHEFDRAVQQFFGNERFDRNINGSVAHWRPAVNVSESKDSYILTMDLPGVHQDDIHISYEDGMLKIEGERKRSEEEGINYLRNERFYGKFSRVFRINTPIQSDNIEANYKNGLLTIHILKAEEAKTKEIKIKA